MIQHGQGCAGMVHVRIRHGRIFTQYIHAVDRAIMNGVNDLDHRKARLRIQFCIPQFFKFREVFLLDDF